MNKILYISLTGMTEPLGRSQVLEYLIELSKTNEIFLISFERENDLDKLDEIKKIVNKHDIKWQYLIYSNKYGIISSIAQILKGTYIGSKLINKNSIEIIHARSLIPAVMGFFLKKIYNVKLLFDIRGFTIDEKVDSGRLKKDSFLFKVLKNLDNFIYKNSDYIVSLTYKAKDIIHKDLNIPEDKISVIPTCANKNIFKIMSEKEKNDFKLSLGYNLDDIIIIHTGTVSGWYDFEKEVVLMKNLMGKNNQIHFLILNKNEHKFINNIISKFNLPQEKVKIISSNFDEVYKYLNIADASLFFIKPSYSKQSSAPTKFAENVACYLPSITNKGVGDMEYYLSKYKVGLIIDLENFYDNLDKIVDETLNLLKNKNKIDKKNFEELFNTHFDKQIAIEYYNQIYEKLGKGC